MGDDVMWARGIVVQECDWSEVAKWLCEVPQPARGNRAEMALHDAMAEIERLRASIRLELGEDDA